VYTCREGVAESITIATCLKFGEYNGIVRSIAMAKESEGGQQQWRLKFE